jgi:hypothetical protein
MNLHLLRFDAEIMLQHAAHEDDGGRAILRGADALAAQILRRLDADARPHIDAGMAKNLRQRDRQGDERAAAACQKSDIGGERQLGDLELLVLQHARKDLPRPHHLDVEIDAGRSHPAIDQRPGAVIVPAGESQRQIRHAQRATNNSRVSRLL